MAESGASVESSTPGGVQVWRPWIVVALAGLLVVVAAAAAGLLVRPDPVREVAAGESLVLAASPPTTEDTVTRDVTLDAGVSVRLTTQGALGETLDVVPPEGGSFVVVRVTDPGWGVGTVDAVAVPTTVTLVDGSRRTEVTGATTPARLAGVRYTTTAVAVERSGEDAYRGLSLEAERGGSVTSVDLAPTSPEPVPPVPSEVPGARAVPCAPLDWPDGWAPEDNQYDDCTAAAYPLVRTLGVLGPAPDGSVWLPVVVDPEGGFLRATRSDGTYRLASIPAEVAYRLGSSSRPSWHHWRRCSPRTGCRRQSLTTSSCSRFPRMPASTSWWCRSPRRTTRSGVVPGRGRPRRSSCSGALRWGSSGAVGPPPDDHLEHARKDPAPWELSGRLARWSGCVGPRSCPRASPFAATSGRSPRGG
ncbi:hypothetical protein [Nocardioides zeae]